MATGALRLLTRRFGVIALSMPLLVLAAGPAAASGTIGVAAYGLLTVTPGWTTTPAFQQLHFDSTYVVYADSVNGMETGVSCAVDAASVIAETLQAGQGSGSWTCTGGIPNAVNIHGTFSYTRSWLTSTINGRATGSIGSTSVSCSVTEGVIQVLTPIPPYLASMELTLSC